MQASPGGRLQSGRGDRCGRVDDRRPVALHPIAERVLCEHQRRGEGQRHKQRPDGSACPPRKTCRERPASGEEDEHQRRDEADLAADQFADEVDSVCRAPLGHASALPSEAGPVVVGIPQHHGQEDRPTEQRTKPWRGLKQLALKRRRHQQPQRNAEPEEGGGVFACHRQTGEQADCQPPISPPHPSPTLRDSGLEPARDCPQAAGPEEQQRRVGVMITAPTPSSSVALSSAAASRPARRPGNRRSAASASSSEATATENGPISRMPRGVSPTSAVPRRTHSATMGG